MEERSLVEDLHPMLTNVWKEGGSRIIEMVAMQQDIFEILCGGGGWGNGLLLRVRVLVAGCLQSLWHRVVYWEILLPIWSEVADFIVVNGGHEPHKIGLGEKMEPWGEGVIERKRVGSLRGRGWAKTCCTTAFRHFSLKFPWNESEVYVALIGIQK